MACLGLVEAQQGLLSHIVDAALDEPTQEPLGAVGRAQQQSIVACGNFFEQGATDAVARYAAASAGILLVALLAWLAVYSPVVHRYPEWRVASEVGESFLARVRTLLVQTPDGRVVEGPPLPTWVRPARGAEMEPRVFGAAIFSTYTIEAWARLEFPDRRILVHPAPTIQGAQAAADEVLLIFTARLEGY